MACSCICRKLLDAQEKEMEVEVLKRVTRKSVACREDLHDLSSEDIIEGTQSTEKPLTGSDIELPCQACAGKACFVVI